MKSNRSSFWKEFAVGGLLFAGLGLFYVNQVHAWGDYRNFELHHCLGEHLWLLWPSDALENCMPGYTDGDATIFDETPDDWETIGIERAREQVRKMKALSQADTTKPESDADGTPIP
jgi:hypothetical protein